MKFAAVLVALTFRASTASTPCSDMYSGKSCFERGYRPYGTSEAEGITVCPIYTYARAEFDCWPHPDDNFDDDIPAEDELAECCMDTCTGSLGYRPFGDTSGQRKLLLDVVRARARAVVPQRARSLSTIPLTRNVSSSTLACVGLWWRCVFAAPPNRRVPGRYPTARPCQT